MERLPRAPSDSGYFGQTVFGANLHMNKRPPLEYKTHGYASSLPVRIPRRHPGVDVAVATCILAARMASAADASGASAGDRTAGVEIQEVTVTANRRVENAQDVPISIQALTGEALQQLSIANFDDAVKYLPNVTLAGGGPGQSNIYMRGLSVGPGTIQGSGAVGDFPNVAVYLDDQSAQLPSRNLDIYAADLERIEVLEGPQGTLFGAGAEAGVVRYITNKPKLDRTEGNVNAGYAYTAHGDHSSNADAMINLPLISDTLAFRAAIYSDTRGGYINNVPGTFVAAEQRPRHSLRGLCQQHARSGDAAELGQQQQPGRQCHQPGHLPGHRAGALCKINEDWNALLVQSYQDMDAQGVFYETPTGLRHRAELPDLSVQLYNPSYDKDGSRTRRSPSTARSAISSWYTAALTWCATSIRYRITPTTRAGRYADYYQCIPPSGTTAAQCYSPSTTWRDHERDIHQSHELRLAHARGLAAARHRRAFSGKITDPRADRTGSTRLAPGLHERRTTRGCLRAMQPRTSATTTSRSSTTCCAVTSSGRCSRLSTSTSFQRY